MLLFVHTAIGALIASKTSNPFLGSGIAFASHYIFDLIPHEPSEEIFYISPDKENRSKEIIDKIKKRSKYSLIDLFICSLVFIGYTLNSQINNFAEMIVPSIIIFFALFPDVFTVLTVFKKNKFLSWHYDIHYKIHLVFPLKMNYFTAYFFQSIIALVILFFTFTK